MILSLIGETLTFTLGQGQVIEGWDQGIKTMKMGEIAIFTIPPVLAYGESGSPPTIPPNATLQFDVELLSWVSAKDICKDGGIFKKIVKEGEKWENPKDIDEVLVKYEAKLEDGTVVAKSIGTEFTVEEGHFCPAISKAVKTMKKGEKVLLTVKPQYGFGEKGKPASGDEGAVPPNATLSMSLELVSWKTVSNVTDDKKVVKKGYERLNEGAEGAVGKSKLQDGTVASLFRVKKLSDKAIMPLRGPAGYDLFSAKGVTVPARGKALIPTDLSISIPEGTYAQMMPHSGLDCMQVIKVVEEVIDADYRGPVEVVLFNLSDVDFEVKAGDRIARLIIARCVKLEVIEVDTLKS